MKEYYVIHYYDPKEEVKYSTDPTLYPTEADARAHVKKDVYSMIDCRKYSNSDLLGQIFEAFCDNTTCKKCHYYSDCYCGNPYDAMSFGALDEQKQLEVCATMARQFEEAEYEEEEAENE